MKIKIERNYWKTKIPLSQGYFVQIDRKNYAYLSQWKWHYTHGYAVRRIHKRLRNNEYTGNYVYMHRLIMQTPEGMVTDHINGDSLDNREKNLRNCTQRENMLNKRVQTNSVSGIKGVRWNKHKNRYEPNITVHGKKIYLGRFETIEEAERAYKEASVKYFGEFAHAYSKHR